MSIVVLSNSIDESTTRNVPVWVFIACALPGIVAAAVKAQSTVYVPGVSTGLNDMAFFALGPCAWIAYLPAAKHAGWHVGSICLIFLLGVLFPFWGMFGMLMGFGYGGPVLCTAWWSMFLVGAFGLRGAGWVMAAGLVCNLVSLAAAFAYKISNPAGEMLVLFMPFAVVSWHVFHPIGLYLAARSKWIRAARDNTEACPACGYDTIGLIERICPECGGALPADDKV